MLGCMTKGKYERIDKTRKMVPRDGVGPERTAELAKAYREGHLSVAGAMAWVATTIAGRSTAKSSQDGSVGGPKRRGK